jgi:hypothetical protein
MDTVFVLAGIAMGAHMLCSLMLPVALRGTPLADELFAMPNAWLGPRPKWPGFRLLRARYVLPRVSAPPGMRDCASGTRVVFFLARVFATAFPLLVLAFLATAFVVSR